MPKTEELVMRWLPVEDKRGHTRMEAVWILVPVGVSTRDIASTQAA